MKERSFSVSTAFDEADAAILAAAAERCARVIGLCGAQGSGKSTASARLERRWAEAGRNAAVLSLDDFYLTRAERRALGRDVHPLFETRGVPGTHDVDLACAVIDALVRGQGAVTAPVFDKAADDRAPVAEWKRYQAPIDVVLLEGWCVGARPWPDEELAAPINALEREEDAEGSWRVEVNAALGGSYRELFGRLDLRVLLRADDFARVHAWRLQQEQGLRRLEGADPPMDERAIARFISHYERLTRWILRDEPADLVIDIDADRRPLGCRSGRR